MPLHLLKTELTQHTKSIQQYTETIKQQLHSLEDELASLTASEKDHPEIITLINYYTPLISALQLLYGITNDANQELTGAYFHKVKSRKLKESYLKRKQTIKQKAFKKISNSGHYVLLKKYRTQRLETQLKQIAKNLETLTTLDELHPDIFSEIEHLQKIIKQDLNNRPISYHHSQEWLNTLSDAETSRVWNAWHQKQRNISLTPLTVEQQDFYLKHSQLQFYVLYYYDGWDLDAIVAFQQYFIYQLSKESQATDTILTKLFNQERTQVGSPTYLILFKNSHYSPVKKLGLLLDQLGAEVDEFQMLQLLGSFSIYESLSPHSNFIELLCQTVQLAFANKNLESRELHQLRAYFDRQNILYIRENFPAQTDEVSLQQYVAAPSPKGLNGVPLIRERGRFHNKIPKGMTYASYVKQFPNRKRLTPNFHSEFILDKHGHFVSQWNILKTSGQLIESNPASYEWGRDLEAQLLNTESLNYGRKNDLEHKRLDSYPPGPYDHMLRKAAKKSWSSPTTTQYSFRKIDRKRQRKI